MAKSNARVPLVERDKVASPDLPAYDHVAKSRGTGRMPNVFKALANNPAVMERVAAVGEYMRFQSKIDPQLRELAILTTAQEIRCVYEWTAHYTIAQKLGVSAKLLGLVGTPHIESEAAPLGAELRFARLVARGDSVDDATFDAVKNHLGNAGVLDLIGLVGYYGLLARMLNTLQVPLDEGVDAIPFVK